MRNEYQMTLRSQNQKRLKENGKKKAYFIPFKQNVLLKFYYFKCVLQKSQNDNEKRIPNDIEKPKSEATKGKWNPKHISSYSQTNRNQNYLVT